MAIIKGVRAADVSEVTPYQEDWDKVGAGIMAREDRANEVRNMIAENRAAMLKETRDNPEDFAKAQELEQGFKTDVDSMLNQAGQDYSQVSKSNIQRLAMDYAGKTDFRVLSEAKRNHDEAIKQRQAIESKGGVPYKFGPADPINDPLFKDDNSPNTFTGNWEYQELLQHGEAAKKVFDQLGVSIFSEEKFKNDPNYIELRDKKLDDGSTVKDWVAYWEKESNKHTNNWNQVNAAVQGAIGSFKQSPEGAQYFRIHYENMLYGRNGVPKKSEAEAREYANHKVVDLIKSYGESEKLDSVEKTLERTPIAKESSQGLNPTGSRSSGKGGDEPPARVPLASGEATVSSEGTPGEKNDDVINYYQTNISKDVSVADVAKTVNQGGGDVIQNSTNPFTTVSIATMVENPNDNNEANSGQAGGSGYYYDIDQSKGKKTAEQNRTAVKIKHDQTKKYSNTTLSNYGKYTLDGNDRLNVIVNDDGDTESYDVDQLVDKLGDDLFSYDDLQQVMKNHTKTEDPNLKYLRGTMISGKEGDRFLSSFSVNPSTGETTLSPILNDLEALYTTTLAKTNLKPGERILYEAKLQKVREKKAEARAFTEENKAAVEKVKQQVILNNEHNKMFETNIYLTADGAGLSREFTDAFLGKSADSKDLNYKNKVANAKKTALEESDLYKPVIDEYKPSRLVNNHNPYSPEDDAKYTSKLKTLFNNYRNKIIEGDHTSNYDLSNELHDEFIGNIRKDTELLNYIQQTGGIEQVRKNSFLYNANGADFDKSYNENLGKTFNQKPNNIRKFVDEVQGFNDTITRKNVKLFKTASNSDKTGNAEKTLEEKSIFGLRNSKEWRNSKYETPGEGQVGPGVEAFNKDDMTNYLMKSYNELKDSNQLQGNKSYEQYEKEQLDNAYQGVRLDIGKNGMEVVAQYKLGTFEFEHNANLQRDDLIQYFGVPSLYFSLGDELKKGLASNQAMYADIGESEGVPKVRIHQAQSNIGLDVTGTSDIDKGHFYILAKTDNLKDDPNAGSTLYHPNDKTLKKHKFDSYDDFFAQMMNNPQQKMNNIVIKEMLSYKEMIEGGYSMDKIFEPGHPMSGLTREQALQEIKNVITKVAGKGNFKSASSEDEYVTTGTVSVTDTGKHVIPSDVLGTMSNEDQIKLGVTYNPNLANQTWIKDTDGQHYLANPAELVPIEPTNLTSTISNDSKMKFQPDVANFVLNTDNLIKSVRDLASSGDLKRKIVQSNKDKTPINIGGVMMNPEDLKSFEDLTESDMLVITSGLRSIQDNVHAYRNNLKDITVSPHMRGESIDIRTEPGSKDDKNRHYKAGQALWKFLATPSGKAFLKANNMNAIYHDAGTGYHIDLTKATKNRPAGESKAL